MSLWIPVTLAAATFQTVRFMLQKSLSSVKLSATGATFARFAYSMPLVLLGLVVAMRLSGLPLPALPPLFWLYAAIGGLSQILATIFVVALFKQRNFAVGITFKKTELIQTAILGFVVLGDTITPAAGAAIFLGLVAVLLLSKNPRDEGRRWQHLINRASVLGLGSGVLFAFLAVFYRKASLQVDVSGSVLRAGVMLAAVVTMQLLSMLIWFLWRDRDEIAAVCAARRQASFIGLFSRGGSFCWFLAFTLQSAA